MKFIDIHTHTISNQNSVFEIENCYPNAVGFKKSFSIGIHPWYIKKENIKDELLFVEERLQEVNCCAVGECGLDKLIETNFELQIDVFKKQVRLSEKYQKPLVIHCVKSFQEIIQLKKEINPSMPWIIHGFNKHKQVAQSLTKNGFYISFGKPLLSSNKLQEAFLSLPLDTFFLETDDSKILIKDLYQKAAEIRKLKIIELQEIIHQNFNKVFIK